MNFDEILENEVKFEENCGFKIISSFRIDNDTRLVLCYNKNNQCTPFVYWHCNNEGNCFWGHYFENYKSAYDDYLDKINELSNR